MRSPEKRQTKKRAPLPLEIEGRPVVVCHEAHVVPADVVTQEARDFTFLICSTSSETGGEQAKNNKLHLRDREAGRRPFDANNDVENIHHTGGASQAAFLCLILLLLAIRLLSIIIPINTHTEGLTSEIWQR